MLWKWSKQEAISIVPEEQITFLSHFDGNLNDSAIGSTDSDAPTNYGVTFDSTNKKFGTHSAYFDGTSHLAWPNHNDYILGSSFQIDLWVRPTISNSQVGILGMWSWSSPVKYSWLLWCDFSGNLRFVYSYAGTSYSTLYGDPLIRNNWNHIRVTLYENQLRLFQDGVKFNEWTLTSTIYASNLPLCIGGCCPGNSFFEGQIDEIMIMNNYCGYTSANNFTPPTEPY